MSQQIPQNLSPESLHKWLHSKSAKPILIDVREDDELLIAPFPFPVIHLPLSQSSVWLSEFSEKPPREQPVVVICHRGVRSWNFATWLIEQDWQLEVWNLQGGIAAWSEQVDPSVARY